jgi:hypothetical protein
MTTTTIQTNFADMNDLGTPLVVDPQPQRHLDLVVNGGGSVVNLIAIATWSYEVLRRLPVLWVLLDHASSTES